MGNSISTKIDKRIFQSILNDLTGLNISEISSIDIKDGCYCILAVANGQSCRYKIEQIKINKIAIERQKIVDKLNKAFEK